MQIHQWTTSGSLNACFLFRRSAPTDPEAGLSIDNPLLSTRKGVPEGRAIRVEDEEGSRSPSDHPCEDPNELRRMAAPLRTTIFGSALRPPDARFRSGGNPRAPGARSSGGSSSFAPIAGAPARRAAPDGDVPFPARADRPRVSTESREARRRGPRTGPSNPRVHSPPGRCFRS
jgi:hypothetical protein